MSPLVVAEKNAVSQYTFQLLSEMRLYTSSKDYRHDDFLKCAVEREVLEERRRSLDSVGKKRKCV